MSVAFSAFVCKSVETFITQGHLEKIDLRRHQLRRALLPKPRLLKGLNQNSLSEIVQFNVKNPSEVATKFLLPQRITPHMYEGECRDIHHVIHKTNPLPRPITPVNQNHPVWQFDQISRIKISVADNTVSQ